VSWATEADVLSLTGTAVAEDELTRAQAQIEMAVGRTDVLATAEMNARDLEWLRRAVAYQAAWASNQPDLYTRTEVTSLAQDGISVQFQNGALALAPLARRAIRRLSWVGQHSTEVEPFNPTVAVRYPVGGPIIDYPFEGEGWQPL
jgi:hypothetical protein